MDNQMSVLKRHKRTAHGDENDGLIENTREAENNMMDTDMDEPPETKLEELLTEDSDSSINVEGITCDVCDFKTTAKLKHNQNSVMKRHKRTAHGEDKDALTDVVVDKRGDIFEKEESDEAGLSCGICGFVSTAKSKNNQHSVMGRHNRKVHGNGEYADIHLSNNPEPKEEQIITFGEDFN